MTPKAGPRGARGTFHSRHGASRGARGSRRSSAARTLRRAGRRCTREWPSRGEPRRHSGSPSRPRLGACTRTMRLSPARAKRATHPVRPRKREPDRRTEGARRPPAHGPPRSGRASTTRERRAPPAAREKGPARPNAPRCTSRPRRPCPVRRRGFRTHGRPRAGRPAPSRGRARARPERRAPGSWAARGARVPQARRRSRCKPTAPGHRCRARFPRRRGRPGRAPSGPRIDGSWGGLRGHGADSRPCCGRGGIRLPRGG